MLHSFFTSEKALSIFLYLNNFVVEKFKSALVMAYTINHHHNNNSENNNIVESLIIKLFRI